MEEQNRISKPIDCAFRGNNNSVAIDRNKNTLTTVQKVHQWAGGYNITGHHIDDVTMEQNEVEQMIQNEQNWNIEAANLNRFKHMKIKSKQMMDYEKETTCLINKANRAPWISYLELLRAWDPSHC